MANGKLFRMSRVRPKCGAREDIDTIKEAKKDGTRRGLDVLMQAQQYWSAMDKFRRDRARNKRYAYGDQWRDVIEIDGRYMTEEEYIKSKGNVPLKNNLIRRLVRNVLGVYRNQAKEPVCTARDRDEQRLGETMSTVLQYNMQLNNMKELNARTMEEYLISGLPVQRKSFGWRDDRMDCWTDYVSPNIFFVDNCMRDFRGRDVSCLGEIHDIDFNTLCTEFAKSPADVQRLRDIYSFSHDRQYIATYAQEFGYARNTDGYDFMFTDDPSRCRVIEVWRKEAKPRYRCHDWNAGKIFKIDVEDYDSEVRAVNEQRIMQAQNVGMPLDEVPLVEATWYVDSYWYFYYLTPFGDILKEGETPYNHKGHPYIFKPYPFIDGEIHSFVGDVIDQQRYVNRLITLNDWMIRVSAKGALLFPEECLPDGMSIEDIADVWSEVDGIIAYKAKPGIAPPQQIANRQTYVGLTDLLNLQLKFFEDISGVNGALQGKPGYSQMSGSLYAQQTQNATTALLDILEAFDSFVIDGAKKDVKNIQQFYDEKKIIKISGKDAVCYDPSDLGDVDFDLAVAESSDTAVYRQQANEVLLKMFESQAISIEQLLKHGSFPFSDALLQDIEVQKQQMQQGQMPQGISPQLQQQAMAGANPQQMQQAQEMLQQ